MGRKLVIEAPSHVHMGNPDLSGDYGRLYGTLGLALEEPRLVLEASCKGEGCECARPDAERVYEELASHYGCRPRITVRREIPPHVGLGSTTPLYLAIAHAFHSLCGKGPFDPLRWAPRLGRGLVSALGVYSYMYGGLILDGGFRPGSGRVPPLVFHASPPPRLRVVVALPERPLPRILELKARESQILAGLPRMPPSMADRLSRILLMGVLANAADGDWEAAGRYITLFNRELGKYWAREQGGIYCCREAEALVRALERAGALFAGQSSWGPTVYAGFWSQGAEEALEAARRVLADMGGGRAWVTRVSARGAVLRWL